MSGINILQSVSPVAYMNETGFGNMPYNVVNNDFRNALDKVFELDRARNLNSTGLSNTYRINDENFLSFKKQFETPNHRLDVERENAGSSNTPDSDNIENITNAFLSELQFSTMNHLIFGVSSRFSSSMNQIMRGQ